MKVKELVSGQNFETFFIIKSVQVKKASNNSDYLEMNLSDGVDNVIGRKFKFTDSLPQVNHVISLKGRFDEKYNSVLINSFRYAEKGEYPEDYFLPKCPRSSEEMWGELLELINENVLELDVYNFLISVLDREKDSFKAAPGALSHHHAYLGGLLEHTLSVAKTAVQLAKVYNCNLGLTVAGAVLHDFGKIWEYKWSEGQFEMTDEGALIGHIPLGLGRLDLLAKDLLANEETRTKILHIIGSHHGILEWGAVKEPMIPEAMVVAAADNLDANMYKMLAAREQARPGETSKWDRTMKRFVWVKDITEGAK